MRSRIDLTLHMLDRAHDLMIRNIEEVSLEEALFVPMGGYRSILGTLKHAAGWSQVYRSYAFDEEPVHWQGAGWPHGLRDTIVPSEAYFSDIIEWFNESHRLWRRDLEQITDEQLDELRPLHWGEQVPLFDIVAMIARHHVYHAGEINQVLSICRGEAWEEGEEVEENNISTVGHRVRPPWLD
jgi:uncharacterized damage-inducible protein DinB